MKLNTLALPPFSATFLSLEPQVSLTHSPLCSLSSYAAPPSAGRMIARAQSPRLIHAFYNIAGSCVPSANMTTTSMIQPKFLSKPDQLGVVAVGFSGGQASPRLPLYKQHS